jgi:hypothetical protein
MAETEGIEYRQRLERGRSYQNDGGISMKTSDYSCVPLRSDCHTTVPAYHRVGKREFERSRDLSFAALVTRLQLDWIRKSA